MKRQKGADVQATQNLDPDWQGAWSEQSGNSLLSPDAYAALLRDLGFESTRHVADFFGVAQSSANKWAKDGPTPPVVKMLLVMKAMGWRPEDVERMLEDGR